MNNELSPTERQKIEAQYHDNIIIDGVQCCRRASKSAYYEFFNNLISNIKGLTILDLGCGEGWLSINMVRRGGYVCGIDISKELLKLAGEQAERQGFNKHIHFARMAAEDLAFNNDYFDMVIGSAILHHTNIELTLHSIHRVLKTDGRAIFIEPMNENIILKIWRKLTPWRRSPLERALEIKDLEMIKNLFPLTKLRYFGLSSIITEGLMIVFPRNKLLVYLDNLLSRTDAYILKRFSFIRKYCAVVVLDLKK